MPRAWLPCLLLLAALLAAYQPALRGAFLWDDDSWTTGISGLLRDVPGLCRLWSHPTALQQYYPVTGASFWLDCHLWGLRPLACHLENVLLHALAALLFFRLLRRLHVPGAAFAAALLALHPLMVESVAWITERKNVLSLVFFLASLFAYGCFTRFWEPEPQKPGAPADSAVPNPLAGRAYALSFVFFLAAMLAKATAFCLPAALVLICWWKRARIRWRADVFPLLPFFAAAIGLGLGTTWIEAHHVGASGVEWNLSFPQRCLIAGRAFWFYLGKLLWPQSLCFVYPRWQLEVAAAWQWLYPAAALGVLLGLWTARQRIGRGPVAALLFFVGSLLPVLGFMNAYFMRYSFVCDHWAYLASLGPLALAAALASLAARRVRLPIAAARSGAGVILCALGLLTWRHSAVFTDNETLWRRTLERNPGCWMALDNLSNVLFKQGHLEEAMRYSRMALDVCPADEISHTEMGDILQQQGRFEEAVAEYERAIDLAPEGVIARYSLANLLVRAGKTQAAEEQFREALDAQPDCAPAHQGLANILRQTGRRSDAIAHYRAALALHPDYANAHNNLGNLLIEEGKKDDAAAHYAQALAIEPNHAEAHNNLGVLLFQRGQTQAAVDHWRAYLKANPDYAEARKNLARAGVEPAP